MIFNGFFNANPVYICDFDVIVNSFKLQK